MVRSNGRGKRRPLLGSFVRIAPWLLGIVALHAGMYLSPIGQGIESSWFDRWIALRGPIAAPKEVVLVAMDEESYTQLGLSPTEAWPRAMHARLVERLAALGARRVVFDVLFVGAGASEDENRAFGAALTKIPVVLGAEIAQQASAGYSVTELTVPYEPFGENAAATALVNLPEKNGVVRSFFVPGEDVGYNLPSLASAADSSTEVLPDERALISFYGPAGLGPRVFSYYQILEDEVPFPAELVRDKIVFVGLMLQTAVGPAQKDSFMTPFGRMFGVEIHATAAANIVRGDWLRRLPRGLELTLLSALALVVGYAALALGPARGIFALLGLFVLWGGAGRMALGAGWMIPGALLFGVVAPLTYTISTFFHYRRSRRERRELERAFGYYLAPAMVRELARNPDALKLGGELVEATAVFTDLADFTTISESLSPQGLVAMLNDYFSCQTKIVHEEGGTLIKFIGDAMFVVWGAPIPLNDHAARAIRAAEKMQRALKEFNARGAHPYLHARIGINTGPMVVGNLGAESRFDYTAIGDSVNLASRIEGLNKYVGTSILLTEAVVQAARRADAVKIGRMQVKGKELSVMLYALFDEALPDALAKRWAQALEDFAARRWAAAVSAFEEIEASASPLRRISAFYRTQTAHLAAVELDAAWSGEVVFETK